MSATTPTPEDNDGKPAATGKATLGGLLRRGKPLGGWLAGVAAAVVSTVVAAWIVTNDDPQPADDGLPFTHSVRVYHDQAFGWVSGRELPQLPDRPGFDGDWDRWGAEWDKWMAAAEAVPAVALEIDINIQGRSDAQVTLTDLRVRVVKRAPAIRGTVVLIPGGDPGFYRYVDVDLDEDPPAHSPTVDEAFDFLAQEHELRPIRFPYRVSLSAAESFLVNAHTDRCDCAFVIDLSWASQGRTGTVAIDDEGKPFRVTGRSNVTHTCTYWETFGSGTPEECVKGQPE